jgi:putative phage-type endonuclease
MKHSIDLNVSAPRPFGLGGSDVCAALGLSPYKTPLALWAEKLGLPGVAPAEGLALRVGQHLEPFIAQEYERVSGHRTRLPDAIVRAPGEPHFYGHLDRVVCERPSEASLALPHESQGETQAPARTALPSSPSRSPSPSALGPNEAILECKSVGLRSQHLWGEAGTDAMPVSYLVQCVWYLWLTQAKRADVAVLIGNHDFRIYQVHRDTALEAMVLERARSFWHEHVLAGVPPVPVSGADLQWLHPDDDGSVREVDDETRLALMKLADAQQHAKHLDETIEALRLQVTSFMGECALLQYQGKVLASFKRSKPVSRFDLKAFEAEHPALACRYRSQSPGTRRFLLKANVQALLGKPHQLGSAHPSMGLEPGKDAPNGSTNVLQGREVQHALR